MFKLRHFGEVYSTREAIAIEIHVPTCHNVLTKQISIHDWIEWMKLKWNQPSLVMHSRKRKNNNNREKILSSRILINCQNRFFITYSFCALDRDGNWHWLLLIFDKNRFFDFSFSFLWVNKIRFALSFWLCFLWAESAVRTLACWKKGLMEITIDALLFYLFKK